MAIPQNTAPPWPLNAGHASQLRQVCANCAVAKRVLATMREAGVPLEQHEAEIESQHQAATALHQGFFGAPNQQRRSGS
jgi:hypothetical protein